MARKKIKLDYYACISCRIGFLYLKNNNSVPCPKCFSSCNVVRHDNALAINENFEYYNTSIRRGKGLSVWNASDYVNFLAKKKKELIAKKKKVKK